LNNATFIDSVFIDVGLPMVLAVWDHALSLVACSLTWRSFWWLSLTVYT